MNQLTHLLLLTFAACTVASPPRQATANPPDLPAQFANLPSDASAEPAAAWGWQFGDEWLGQAISEALAHNHTLAAAQERFAAAVAAAGFSAGDLTPQLDAAFDASRSKRVFLGFPFGGGAPLSSTTTTFGLALNVSWELDVWGRVRSGAAASAADAEASAALLDAARLSLVGQTCKAYFAVVEGHQQVELSQRTVDNLRTTVQEVRTRYHAGLRPALDLHQAEANLATAVANASQRADVLQRARRQLEVLCGQYPAGTRPSALTLPERTPTLPKLLPSELLLRRPDLAAAERRLAAAGCRVAAAQAALFPRLALSASGGASATELRALSDSDLQVFSLGSNLLQPLLHGGELRAEVARQQAIAREALANYQQSVLAAFAEVEAALSALQSLEQRRGELAKAASSAIRARDLARDRYRQGLIDFLAVADSQRQAFAAESSCLSGDRQRLDNLVDLLLALGGDYPVASSRDSS